MTGPLAGTRVLDLSSVVLGPLATQIMGDLGADVIKIEAPAGDTTRYTGPARSGDMAALFMGLNRNKRSLVLDLKQEGARDALWRLIVGADVFVHSIRPQKLAALGFGQKTAY
ncbi:MAG: CoA transferase, partial [Alphaproteobacteria bacterium]